MIDLDTSTAFGKRIARQLDDEQVLWLTTVGKSGTPAPTPVWFLWHDGEILISSQPDKAKLHNIAARPQVALNFNATHTRGGRRRRHRSRGDRFRTDQRRGAGGVQHEVRRAPSPAWA